MPRLDLGFISLSDDSKGKGPCATGSDNSQVIVTPKALQEVDKNSGRKGNISNSWESKFVTTNTGNFL